MIDVNNDNISSLALAYLGDSIYEVYIRTYLINKGISKMKDFQTEAIKFVSAKNQTIFLNEMIEKRFLSDKELEIVYRARNHKSNHKPKNTDIITYKYSTGFEALIGYLYVNKNESRLNEIMEYIFRR